MFEKVLKNAQLQQAAQLAASASRRIPLSGVWGSSAPLIAAATGCLAGRPVLFVTAHLDAADDAADDIEVFTGRAPQLFPAWDTDVFAADHVNDEIAGEREGVADTVNRATHCGDHGFFELVERGDGAMAPLRASARRSPW